MRARRRVFLTACFITTGVALASAEPPENILFNIPRQLTSAVDNPSFKSEFDVGSWINPFYLRGDFDGDGAPDYAVLVTHRSDGKKGIAIWLSSNPGPKPRVIGAGRKSLASSGHDDWDFFDAWHVYGKRPVGRGVGEGRPPKLRGEALLIESSEASSGLLYWDGKQFRWYQQGD